MNCHYCGYNTPVPKQCGACGSSKLKMVGFGTEKIEEELQELLGNSVRIQRMDLDTTRKKNAYHEIIQSLKIGKLMCLLEHRWFQKDWILIMLPWWVY